MLSFGGNTCLGPPWCNCRVGSHVDNGPWYILIIGMGPKQHQGLALLALWHCEIGQSVFSVIRSWRGGSFLPSHCWLEMKAYGLLEGPVVQDLPGGRHICLIGVKHRSRSSSSSILLESWVVFSMVLTVLTCHSMKPLDLGKWGRRWCGLYDCAVRTGRAYQT